MLPYLRNRASALVDAATAFANVLSPSSITLPVNSVAITPSPAPVAKILGHNSVSPSKLANIWIQNLEQLHCMKKLMDDGVLSQKEFIEQEIILQVLHDL